MEEKARRLLVCVVISILLIAALAGCERVAPGADAGNVTGTPRPVAGTATEIRRQIAGQTDLGLAEWDRLVSDARLIAPLFIAYTKLDQWRPIARASAARGTTYTIAPLDGSVAGEYTHRSGGPGRVVINATILAEPIDVQVATLAHEIYHSQSAYQDGPQGGAACLSEELHAMAWDAYAYDTVIRPDPVETGWTHEEDHLVTLWHAGQLDQAVLLSAAYQRECLGGVVQ